MADANNEAGGAGAERRNPEREMTLAITLDKADQVAALLAEFPDELGAKYTWEALFERAIRDKNPALLTLCIDKGVDVNTPNEQGATPLMRCITPAWEMDEAMWSTLLARGADPAKGNKLFTPLQGAINARALGVIEALAEAGVSLDEDTDGSSPLRHALRMYALKSFETLLTLGANPNVKDESGETLLHFIVGIAVLGDKAVPAAKLLIDRGGNVDERNADGNTPFLVAIRYGRLDLAQLLEEKGADVHATNDSGENALWILVNSSLSSVKTEVAEYLLSKEVNKDLKVGTETPVTRLRALLSRDRPVRDLVDVFNAHGAEISPEAQD